MNPSVTATIQYQNHMKINFHSTVIITHQFEAMKLFYTDVLLQEIELDFGNCVGFKNGLSLWQLQDEYPIAQHLGRKFDLAGNNNLEICFETDDFSEVVNSIKNHNVRYLHDIVEEAWGQQTIRFYDPDNNLVEIGESMSCFVKRFYHNGFTIEEISARTSVPLAMVKQICTENY